MSPSLTISLVGVAITLAAILVQLGRVLQRADQNETFLKELKDQREKELKPQSDLIAVVRQRTHELANSIQNVNAHHSLVDSRLVHLETGMTELRRDQSTGAGELRSAFAEVLDRLARIETALAHTSPSALPAGRTPASGTHFGPPRRSQPGEPR
jgi:DNA repair exonuclease SbcCD ATPase subunit